MKTALITTTINIPWVLALYRKLGPDVMFFIAGDRKTPDITVVEFLAAILNHSYYGIDFQHKLGYKCSRLLGENCVQRRNIALLEAVKRGADIIVTIDDDNIPTGGRPYFDDIECILDMTFDGIEASSPTGWFDPGCLLVPQTKHRGFPDAQLAQAVFNSVVDVRIGVAAGLCLGDPDIDAVTRIAAGPIIHSVSELGRAGVVVDPRKTKTVFNSQNTAFIRELAPTMFMMPGVGRYDDIYASLICQRIMRERGFRVHFGQPFVWQQRNKHNLFSDLRQEIDGMENIEAFARRLDECVVPSDATVAQQVRYIYTDCDLFYQGQSVHKDAAFAFLDDIEKVL